MPNFAILCFDKPGAGALRAATRPSHLEYLERITDTVVVCGPMIDSDGGPVGSIILAAFPDRAAAEAFAEGDPYAEAGLFEKVVVNEWRQVLPAA